MNIHAVLECCITFFEFIGVFEFVFVHGSLSGIMKLIVEKYCLKHCKFVPIVRNNFFV